VKTPVCNCSTALPGKKKTKKTMKNWTSLTAVYWRKVLSHSIVCGVKLLSMAGHDRLDFGSD